MTVPIILIRLLVPAVIFVNGWTDAPNAIATCVVTRCMSARGAILMAAVFNFLGVFLMSLISPAVAEQLDVLLAPNSHTHLAMPPEMYEPHEKHIQFMIDAFMDIVHSDVAKYVTAIPHPFMAVCCPYGNRVLLTEISDDRFKYCFDAAAEKGIALELNPNTIAGKTEEEIREDPIFRMFRLGKECGCKFTLGSDGHTREALRTIEKTQDCTAYLGLTEEEAEEKILEGFLR